MTIVRREFSLYRSTSAFTKAARLWESNWDSDGGRFEPKYPLGASVSWPLTRKNNENSQLQLESTSFGEVQF